MSVNYLDRLMHRRRWRYLIAVGVVALIFILVSVVLFVAPSTNAPKHVNAVVVLGGSGPRLEQGESLVERGFADTLVVSTSPTGWICPSTLRHIRVICFTPQPLSTRGEAQQIGKLQRQDHWTSILVVTAIPQTSRARIRLDRCFNGKILFDPVDPGDLWSWTYNTIYEWAALFKALVIQRGC